MSEKLLTEEVLLDLIQEGKKPKEIGDEYGLSAQKVGMMIKDLEEGKTTGETKAAKTEDVLSEKNVMDFINRNMSVKEVAERFNTTEQRVELLIRKAEFAGDFGSTDEFPPEMFSKNSNIIRDESMGISVVLTAREYHDYSEANGRYQGRKKGKKTRLDPMELRVAITGIANGDRSANDVREHLINKHGITVDDIKKAAFQLTKEEEVSYVDVLKSLGLRP